MKPWLRDLLGPAYPLAIRLRTSPLVHGATALPGWLPYRRYLRAHPGGLAVDIAQLMGMGAILTAALRFHAMAEASGRRARIVSTSPLYALPGEDMFAAFFEPSAEDDAVPAMSADAYRWAYHRELPQRIPLDQAAQLFAAHFRPNARLRAAIESAGGGVPFAMSVHVRGTDKYLESGKLGLDPVIAAVEQHLTETGARVFLATDEPAVAAALRARFAGTTFVSYDLGEVCEGMPRHFSDLSPHDKALEALVNIFLIAQAPVCVRTSSYLSAISRITNPALRTVTVSRTSGADRLFPEREILASEAQR